MSKSIAITIFFDGNPGRIFYAGQLVTGYVQVHTTEKIKIRGIRLQVTGEAETSWSQMYISLRNTHIEFYSEKEHYMKFEVDLIGSRSGEMYLEPSVYKLPFSFVLPPALPESFGGVCGHITYKAKAVVDRPMRFNDKVEVPFRVIRLFELTRELSRLREPMVLYRNTHLQASGCCCIKGFVEINATINRGFFIPGETLRIDGEMANLTSNKIKYSTISLVQTVEFWGTQRFQLTDVNDTKCVTNDLGTTTRPSLQRGQTDRWENISLVIPQVASSRLNGCRIMDIRYSVEVTVCFDALCSESSASGNIVIGNLPSQETFQPSVVTSQPVGNPTPSNKATGNTPPTIVPVRDDFQQPAVTSQPAGNPMPGNKGTGDTPPTIVPAIGIDTSECHAQKCDGEDESRL